MSQPKTNNLGDQSMSEAVVAAVSAAFGIERCSITSVGRTRTAAHARYAVMVLMREHGASLTSIGRSIGRHHTTVIEGVRQASYLAQDDAEFTARLSVAREIVKEGHRAEFSPASPYDATAKETPPEANGVAANRYPVPDEIADPDVYENVAMRRQVRVGSERLLELLRLEAAQ